MFGRAFFDSNKKMHIKKNVTVEENCLNELPVHGEIDIKIHLFDHSKSPAEHMDRNIETNDKDTTKTTNLFQQRKIKL